MNVRIYLHDSVADMLKMFGSLDDLVNDLLQRAMAGAFDIETLPVSPKGGEVHRYDINVTNEEFLALREARGATSKSLSIRRLLYWFVDNEMWEQFEMSPCRDLAPRQECKYISRAVRICDELVRLQKDAPANHRAKILSMIITMRDILNETRP